jgi:uncharacterized OB-fold protein
MAMFNLVKCKKCGKEYIPSLEYSSCPHKPAWGNKSLELKADAKRKI